MTAGDLLLAVLAWAAVGTWWQRNPSGRVTSVHGKYAPEDEAIREFVLRLPVDLYRETSDDYRRRMGAS